MMKTHLFSGVFSAVLLISSLPAAAYGDTFILLGNKTGRGYLYRDRARTPVDVAIAEGKLREVRWAYQSLIENNRYTRPAILASIAGLPNDIELLRPLLEDAVKLLRTEGVQNPAILTGFLQEYGLARAEHGWFKFEITDAAGFLFEEVYRVAAQTNDRANIEALLTRIVVDRFPVETRFADEALNDRIEEALGNEMDPWDRIDGEPRRDLDPTRDLIVPRTEQWEFGSPVNEPDFPYEDEVSAVDLAPNRLRAIFLEASSSNPAYASVGGRPAGFAGMLRAMKGALYNKKAEIWQKSQLLADFLVMARTNGRVDVVTVLWEILESASKDRSRDGRGFLTEVLAGSPKAVEELIAILLDPGVEAKEKGIFGHSCLRERSDLALWIRDVANLTGNPVVLKGINLALAAVPKLAEEGLLPHDLLTTSLIKKGDAMSSKAVNPDSFAKIAETVSTMKKDLPVPGKAVRGDETRSKTDEKIKVTVRKGIREGGKIK